MVGLAVVGDADVGPDDVGDGVVGVAVGVAVVGVAASVGLGVVGLAVGLGVVPGDGEVPELQFFAPPWVSRRSLLPSELLRYTINPPLASSPLHLVAG